MISEVETTPLGADMVRYVVFDCETTGIDPDKDHLVSIGAIAVCDGEILLDDAFEAVIQTKYNTASVVVHGITQQESLDGQRESVAVAEFLDYVGPDAVLVGHHVGFDRVMIGNVAARIGRVFANCAIDTMHLAIELEALGVFGGEKIENFSLDYLCERFGIQAHDRHTAPGDAYITAQIFLRLWKLARHHPLDWRALAAKN